MKHPYFFITLLLQKKDYRQQFIKEELPAYAHNCSLLAGNQR